MGDALFKEAEEIRAYFERHCIESLNYVTCENYKKCLDWLIGRASKLQLIEQGEFNTGNRAAEEPEIKTEDETCQKQ